MSNKEKIESLKNDIRGLKEKIKTLRDNSNDNSLAKLAEASPVAVGEKHKMKRTLKGHLAKIYATAWAQQDNVHLVSASQDGKLLVWDAMTTNKTHAIHLRSNWVMACDYSPESGWVASGGLDNICSIFSLKPEASKDGPIKFTRELNAHQGYLSCCKFTSETQIITGSGDWTLILWDIQNGTKIQEFLEHENDVMCMALNSSKNQFVSGGCDSSAKLWDVSSGKCVQSFSVPEGDINAVNFFPNNQAIVSGSEDGYSRLFDLRADRELISYTSDGQKTGVTSCAFSSSGRYLFTGCDDNTVQVFDSLNGKKLWTLDGGHDQRVSCLAINSDGSALCTGSWDNYLKIWA